MPKRKEVKPWTFTIEELRHWHAAHPDCPCDACKRVNEYYGVDEEVKELLRKYS